MTVKNLSASVHARLQNHARVSKRPFQELLQYYAMERFLYRLSATPHRARFVLKGALMLHVWEAPLARATKDLDPNAACPETLAEVVPLLAEFLLRMRRCSPTGSQRARRDGFAPLAPSRKCERLRIQAVAPREPGHSHGFALSRDECGAPARAGGPPSDS